MPTTILIIIDDLLVREGLKQLLSQERRGVTFGEAKDMNGALAQIAKGPWDLVILDIMLPDGEGFSILGQICKRRPLTRVLVASAPNYSQWASRAQRMGASGYVRKNAGRADLLRAVGAVLAGKKYFHGFQVSEDDGKEQARSRSLSAREYSVMSALAAGKRVSDIAGEINLSTKTISTYKRRLFNKLQLNSVAELVRYVFDHQLS